MNEVFSETKLRILRRAVSPSRYTDLERSSGVSRSIFNRHLNDLLKEGLIEKTEEGLYVITEEGLEVLMRSLESERRGVVHRVVDALLLVSGKEYPEEVVNTFFSIGLGIIELERLTATFLSSIKKIPTLAVVYFLIPQITYPLSLYMVRKLRQFRKYYIEYAPKIGTLFDKDMKVGEDYPSLVMKMKEVANNILNDLEKLRELSGKYRDSTLLTTYEYIRVCIEELQSKLNVLIASIYAST